MKCTKACTFNLVIIKEDDFTSCMRRFDTKSSKVNSVEMKHQTACQIIEEGYSSSQFLLTRQLCMGFTPVKQSPFNLWLIYLYFI